MYPLAAVIRVGQFVCPVCGSLVRAPAVIDTDDAFDSGARPAPAPMPVQRPQAVQRPAPARPAKPQRAAEPVRAREPVRRQANPQAQAALWVGVGLVVLLGIAWFALRNTGGGTQAPAGPPPSVVKTPPPEPPKDPERDAGAWKALPAAERQARIQKLLAGLDRSSDGAMQRAFQFMKERDEKDAADQVCRWAIEREAYTPWAREALGHELIRDKLEAAIAACPLADDMDVPELHAIKAFRTKHEPARGAWWGDAAQRAEFERLAAALRASEETLKDPAKRAIAKWTVYQRKVEVMREHLSLQQAVGPYLLFVQMKTAAGTPLANVDALELQRANRVLSQNVKVFDAFYKGWTAEMAPILGLATYGSSDVDEKTLLKANIFADETTWLRYHERRGIARQVMSVRAYYESDEPRFIVSHDGPSREHPDHTDQVQCHEAAHQLVHFHTWDQTRKATGKEPPWADCNTVPLWNSEGFAEFFSAFKRDSNGYRWMQPLDSRLQDLWIAPDVLTHKKWAGFGLGELLDIKDYADLHVRSERRVTTKEFKKRTLKEHEDAAMAVPLLTNLFYARSWSLVHFLWWGGDGGGRPKWRDGYVRFLKRQLRVEYEKNEKLGLVPRTLSAADFRKALGIEDAAKFKAFEQEWSAFEANLVKTGFRRDWLVQKALIAEAFGVK